MSIKLYMLNWIKNSSKNPEPSSGDYNAKIDENGVLEVPSTGQDSYIINKLLEEFPIVDTSSWTSTNYMFYMCRKITRIPQLNTSKVTQMQRMFAYCIRLSEIPQLDTSGVYDMSYMFQSCSGLTAISQLNTSNLGNAEGMFNNCRNLIEVPQLDTSKVTYMQNMFQGCSSLSEESLNNILAMCTNAVKIKRNKTLKFIGLTEAQATTCTTLSNWPDCQTAGWSTGY